MTAVVFVIVLLTKFLAGAWIAILAMGIFFMLMKGIRRHYDNVGRGAARRGRRPGAADPGARDRAGLQGAQADDAGAGLRQGDPAQRARGGARRRRPGVDRPAPRGVGRAADRRTAEGAVLAVPRDHPADRASTPRTIRDANPRGVVAVYIPEYVVGPLVGAAAAQPDRAAAQGPAAVHAGRDGDLGALPAALLGARQAARRAGSSTRSAPATSAAARRCAAAPRTTAGTCIEPARRRRRRPARSRGRSLVGERYDVRGRRGRARRARRRPARAASSSSSGTRCRASGSSSRSPRATRATGSCGPTPSRCSRPRRDRVPPPCPFAGPGRCGGCDFQHVDAAGAARAQGRGRRRAAAPAGRARRATSTVEAGPGRRRRPRLAHPGAVRRPARTAAAGCASTAPTTWCRSTTA